MKRDVFLHSLATKTAAILLTLLSFWCGSVLIAAGGVSIGLAGTACTDQAARASAAELILDQYAHRYGDYAYSTPESYRIRLDAQPYPYTVTDNGSTVVSTYGGEPYLATGGRHLWYYTKDGDRVNELSEYEPQSVEHVVTITLYMLDDDSDGNPLTALAIRAVGRWHQRRWIYLIGGAALWLVSLALVIYLCAAVGRHPGEDAPRCNLIDRIPFDIYLAINVFLICIGYIALAEIVLYRINTHLGEVITILVTALLTGVPIALGTVLTVATRIKTRTLWHNTLLFRLWRLLSRGGRALWRGLCALPLIPKTILGVVAFESAEFLLLILWGLDPEDLLVIWLLQKAVLIPLVLWLAIGLRRLQIGARRIADGDIGYTVSTAGLPPQLRRSAEDLNRVRNGISAAVEDRLKSERFKTELITNVSHDIKTPLTSIVNYVDLLAKEPLPAGAAQEYIDVLQRQSGRLKKLVEDLVEASKASTGNLTVTPVPCRLDVLLEQTVGEYATRAEQAELTLRLNTPEQPVDILADERHMGRILDNLMSNICKYAMPGTRVYMDLTVVSDRAQITFRNISKAPLQISGEELAERFVRGDSSRNTEGSGLGLSIARSLAQLQNGDLRITVDGDLFKAVLLFPLMSAEPPQEGAEQ